MSRINIDTIINIIVERIKKDYDLVIAVTGTEGVGKSTCSIQIAKRIEEKFNQAFDFEKNMVYSPTIAEIQEKVTSKNIHCLIGDEAIKLLYKMYWYTKGQKYINTFYALCRKENKISIFAMPKFTDFNKFFREHRIKLWIHIIDRGIGVLLVPDWVPFADSWRIEDNIKILSSLQSFTKKNWVFATIEEKLDIFSHMINYAGYFTFDDLSPQEKETYLFYKNKYAYENIDYTDEKEETLEKYAKMLARAVQIISDNLFIDHESAIKKIGVRGKIKEKILELLEIEGVNYEKNGDNVPELPQEIQDIIRRIKEDEQQEK